MAWAVVVLSITLAISWFVAGVRGDDKDQEIRNLRSENERLARQNQRLGAQLDARRSGHARQLQRLTQLFLELRDVITARAEPRARELPRWRLNGDGTVSEIWDG